MTDGQKTTPLYAIAHARAGDKGDRLSIGLFAYRPDAFQVLCDQVTEDRVHALFAHRGTTSVRRHLLPRLSGMNFVLDGALEGGVNRSLNLDGHGKTASFRLLSLIISAPITLIDDGAAE